MLKMNQRLDKFLSILTTFTLVAMMLHIVAHALRRFFFDSPIFGTNEIVEYWYLPILALLGIPSAQLQKEHITVTLAVDRLNASTANWFVMFACGLGALVSTGFAWFGFGNAMENMAIGSTAGVTDIATWPVHFLVTVVFLLLTVFYLMQIGLILKSRDPDVNLLTGQHTEDDTKDAVI